MTTQLAWSVAVLGVAGIGAVLLHRWLHDTDPDDE